MLKKILFCFFIPCLALAHSAHKGNLAGSRFPATLFGFGQNIIHQNKSILYANMLQQKATQEEVVAFYPSFLYGITNYLSLYVSIPTVPKFELNEVTVHGLGNISAQLEYAWYSLQTADAQIQATIVANLTFPTANISSASFSIRDSIHLYNSSSIFLGGTTSYLSDAWYLYASAGYVFNTTSSSSTTTTTVDMTTTCSTQKAHNGDIAYYQWGIGHSLGMIGPIQAMFDLEFNGIYSKKDKKNSVPQESSGGNIIFCGPTLCLIDDQWQLQVGIQLPILQKVNGTQSTQRYRTMMIGSVKF